MIGRQGSIRGRSSVFVEGELWRARPTDANTTLRPGDLVQIIGRDGLDLIVKQLPQAANQKES